VEVTLKKNSCEYIILKYLAAEVLLQLLFVKAKVQRNKLMTLYGINVL